MVDPLAIDNKMAMHGHAVKLAVLISGWLMGFYDNDNISRENKTIKAFDNTDSSRLVWQRMVGHVAHIAKATQIHSSRMIVHDG